VNRIKKNILGKILNKLSVNKGDKIYLGIDLFKLASELKANKINRYDFVDQVLNFFLNKLGKSGSLIIPVFNFKCINEKKFNQKNSIGQSGALGALLLKKYYKFRTGHPFYSFLCFGKKKYFYKKIKNFNALGENSLWKYFIKDNFQLVTLGHHYTRSFTHVHYLERLAKVKYRYDKNFSFVYTDIYNKTRKKTYSLFVRKKNLCEYSALTKNCDRYLINNNFVKFYRYKKLICFKMDIKSSSKIIFEDLIKKSPKFVSVLKKNKKNTDIIGHKNIAQIETMYMKK
tara:strand:- start:12602 stop:13459 length:858 start_codon:yes stop_codon:yes gene_type:complete